MTVTCSGRRVPALIAQALISQLQLVIRHLTGANTMRALMRAILPLQIPARRGRLGEGRTWLLFELFHVAVLLLVTTTTSPTVAVAGVAAFGAPFAAFLVIPYSIVGRAAAQSDSCGAYMATMNLFLCLPGERWIIIMSILLFTCMFMMNLFLCLPGERRRAFRLAPRPGSAPTDRSGDDDLAGGDDDFVPLLANCTHLSSTTHALPPSTFHRTSDSTRCTPYTYRLNLLDTCCSRCRAPSLSRYIPLHSVTEFLVSLVLGPLVSATGGSLRPPLTLSAAVTLVGAAVIARFLLASPAAAVAPTSATPKSGPATPKSGPARRGQGAACGVVGQTNGGGAAGRESLAVLCRPSLGAADCHADSYSYIDWRTAALDALADDGSVGEGLPPRGRANGAGAAPVDETSRAAPCVRVQSSGAAAGWTDLPVGAAGDA